MKWNIKKEEKFWKKEENEITLKKERKILNGQIMEENVLWK